MSPDLDNDPVVLLVAAAVLWAVAYLIGRRERSARLVVVLTQRRQDRAPDDGVLDQEAQHDQQDGDDGTEQQRHTGVLRGEHAASVPGGVLRFDSPLTPDEAAEWQRRWRAGRDQRRRHG